MPASLCVQNRGINIRPRDISVKATNPERGGRWQPRGLASSRCYELERSKRRKDSAYAASAVSIAMGRRERRAELVHSGFHLRNGEAHS